MSRYPLNIGALPQRGQSPPNAACATVGPLSMSASDDRTLAPHIDADEKEQPHNVDEVPVPGRRLEAEMAGRGELTGDGAEQANRQEDRADDHMQAVEARRHEEGRAVDR